jgi:hypothetical protein
MGRLDGGRGPGRISVRGSQALEAREWAHTPADSIQSLGRAAGVTTWNGHHPR